MVVALAAALVLLIGLSGETDDVVPAWDPRLLGRGPLGSINGHPTFRRQRLIVRRVRHAYSIRSAAPACMCLRAQTTR